MRADGPYDPGKGDWFDPGKLLVDPYAVAIDRPYVYDPRLGSPRGERHDTAPLVPKAVVTELPPPLLPKPPLFSAGGLIYETECPGASRCAIRMCLRAAAARSPRSRIRRSSTHLKKIGVGAVELMPIVAWIDERHLPPLGLAERLGLQSGDVHGRSIRASRPAAWRNCAHTVAALREAGIGVILDLVFNHTGESDNKGRRCRCAGSTTAAYYAHAAERSGPADQRHGDRQHALPAAASGRRSARRSMRFGISCFTPASTASASTWRRCLAATGHGFDPNAPLLRAIADDPVLSDRMLIAEPWDIGPGGYQLGNFPPAFLEWNDRYRDDVRRFWRGDRGHGRRAGDAACRLVRHVPQG